MNRKSKRHHPTPVMIDGVLTITESDNGRKIIDFSSLETVEIAPFKVLCVVQGMRNGDVYITETATYTVARRNPHVFVGRRITVTRRNDGSLRLNFRPVGMGKGFDSGSYAAEVAGEIVRALTSLRVK